MSIKYFENYIKHHEPVFFFFEGEDEWDFCNGMICEKCKCNVNCVSYKRLLSEKDMNKIRKKYPEYFI